MIAANRHVDTLPKRKSIMSALSKLKAEPHKYKHKAAIAKLAARYSVTFDTIAQIVDWRPTGRKKTGVKPKKKDTRKMEKCRCGFKTVLILIRGERLCGQCRAQVLGVNRGDPTPEEIERDKADIRAGKIPGLGRRYGVKREPYQIPVCSLGCLSGRQ